MLTAVICATYSTSAADRTSVSDLANPANFTPKDVVPLNTPNFTLYRQSFLDFLNKTDEGKRFLAENPDAVPPAKLAFRDANPIGAYQLWYAQNYGSGGKSSQEELERVRREERVHANSEHAIEVAQLKNENAVMRGLTGGNAVVSDTAAMKLVERIRTAKTVKDLAVTYTQGTTDITVSVEVDGQMLPPYTFSNLNQKDYLALKLVFAAFENMYSQAYKAASNAMGNLITEILTSYQPQEHHFKQIDDLVSASGGLDSYLKYHQKTSVDLQNVGAFPLAKFLNVKFLPSTEIEIIRERVKKGFAEVEDAITSVGLQGISPSLVNFLDKIRTSIALPSQVSFSDEEIAIVLNEIGFLLETDERGDIVIGGDYAEHVNALVVLFNDTKTAMEKKHENTYKDLETQKLLQSVDAAILANNMRDPCFMEFSNLCLSSGIDASVQIPASKLRDAVKSLATTSFSLPTFAYQDGKAFTKSIMKAVGGSSSLSLTASALKPKLDEAELRPFKAVLFLMQIFAKAQYDKVINRSILSNRLKLDEMAALSLYYRFPIDQIKEALNTPAVFVLSSQDYQDLRKVEAAYFIGSYLDSVIAGQPISADFSALKASILGLTPEIAIKSDCILRVCEFLTLDSVSKNIAEEKRAHDEKEEQAAKAAREKKETYTAKAFDARRKIEPKLSLTKAEEVAKFALFYTGNPEIMRALLRFKILNNNLETEGDKGELASAYLSLEKSVPTTVTTTLASAPIIATSTPSITPSEKLGSFFGKSLAASASSSDFVTAALRLPTIKKDYIEKYEALEAILLNFTDKEKSTGEKFVDKKSKDNQEALVGLKVFAEKALASDLDKLSAVLKHLERLKDSLKTVDEFLNKGDDSGAVATSAGSMAKSPFVFVVAAGLKTLEFSKLFTSDKYFGSLYGAVKVLHYLELTMPSDNDFAFLRQSLITVPGLGSSEITLLEQKIDGVIDLAKAVKANAAEFFKQVQTVLQFAADFKTLKNKYDSTNGIEFNLYANVDKLVMPMIPPAFPSMVAPVTSPLGALAVVFSDAKGLKKFDVPNEDFIYRKLGLQPSDIQNTAPKDLDPVLQKKITWYDELLHVQLAYFQTVDFTQISESNAVHFMRQLMGMIDLYLRIRLYKEFAKAASVDTSSDIRSVKEAVTEFKDKGKAFRISYFNIKNYKVQTLIKLFKNPVNFSDDDTDKSFDLLANLNPALKDVIANAVVQLLQNVSLTSRSFDVTTPILHAIEGYLHSVEQRDTKGLLTSASLNSVISIKVDKGGH